jgi:predicted nuclease of predicted toxin-antitoxin system
MLVRIVKKLIETSTPTKPLKPMACLYVNENFPQPVVEFLRALGHDVTTTRDAGRAGQAIPDDKVLEHAVSEGRAILTLNRRHFVALHDPANSTHAGNIVCTHDADFSRQATRIHDAMTEAGDLTGKLIRVNRPTRIIASAFNVRW